MRSVERATPIAPFEPAPHVSAATRDAIVKTALRVNERYLHEFIEEFSFCPFARGGRVAGQTTRYVHYADTTDVAPLVALMHRIAADPKQVVAQVILPIVQVTPADWVRFCDELTAYAHEMLGGPPVLAFAALHPALPYNTDNPQATIPLFRRSPDPTIQWVRLDALSALYEGRNAEDRYVDPAEMMAYVVRTAHARPSLYDRVADTNAKMARHIGLARVEQLLAAYATDARQSYERLLLADDAAASDATGARGEPDEHPREDRGA